MPAIKEEAQQVEISLELQKAYIERNLLPANSIDDRREDPEYWNHIRNYSRFLKGRCGIEVMAGWDDQAVRTAEALRTIPNKGISLHLRAIQMPDPEGKVPLNMGDPRMAEMYSDHNSPFFDLIRLLGDKIKWISFHIAGSATRFISDENSRYLKGSQAHDNYFVAHRRHMYPSEEKLLKAYVEHTRALIKSIRALGYEGIISAEIMDDHKDPGAEATYRWVCEEGFLGKYFKRMEKQNLMTLADTAHLLMTTQNDPRLAGKDPMNYVKSVIDPTRTAQFHMGTYQRMDRAGNILPFDGDAPAYHKMMPLKEHTQKAVEQVRDVLAHGISAAPVFDGPRILNCEGNFQFAQQEAVLWAHMLRDIS